MKKTKIEIYKSNKNNQFSWRMFANNGRKVACAGETYHNKKDCKTSLSLVKKLFSSEIPVIDTTIKTKKK